MFQKMFFMNFSPSKLLDTLNPFFDEKKFTGHKIQGKFDAILSSAGANDKVGAGSFM